MSMTTDFFGNFREIKITYMEKGVMRAYSISCKGHVHPLFKSAKEFFKTFMEKGVGRAYSISFSIKSPMGQIFQPFSKFVGTY